MESLELKQKGKVVSITYKFDSEKEAHDFMSAFSPNL